MKAGRYAIAPWMDAVQYTIDSTSEQENRRPTSHRPLPAITTLCSAKACGGGSTSSWSSLSCSRVGLSSKGSRNSQWFSRKKLDQNNNIEVDFWKHVRGDLAYLYHTGSMHLAASSTLLPLSFDLFYKLGKYFLWRNFCLLSCTKSYFTSFFFKKCFCNSSLCSSKYIV